MTFPAFMRNLHIRIYEAFYDSMKTKAVQDFLQLCLSKSSSRLSSKSNDEMLRMLKAGRSRKLESRFELRTQFFKEYDLDLDMVIGDIMQQLSSVSSRKNTIKVMRPS